MEYRRHGRADIKVTAICPGATTMARLEASIVAVDIALDEALLDGIEANQKMHSYPSP